MEACNQDERIQRFWQGYLAYLKEQGVKPKLLPWYRAGPSSTWSLPARLCGSTTGPVLHDQLRKVEGLHALDLDAGYG